MADHNEFGKIAEDFAAEFLTKKGYEILERNYRYLSAEVDIIALYEGNIVIIEVKARKHNAVMEPHEAVNRRKMRHVIGAADAYIQQHDITLPAVFDIVSVMPDHRGQLQAEHIPNAFNAIDVQ